MTHFCVVVVGPDLEEQLAPFHRHLEVALHPEPCFRFELERAKRALRDEHGPLSEFTPEQIVEYLRNHPFMKNSRYLVHEGQPCEMTTRNPNSRWGSYRVGGGWSGFFPLKPGAEWRETDVGAPGESLQLLRDRRRVDHVLRQDFDLDRARDDEEIEARESFAPWRTHFERHGRPRGWRDFMREYDGQHELFRHEYDSQPAIAAYHPFGRCPVEWFGFDEEAYVQERRSAACVPYAFVLHGRWFSQGRVGCFGISYDEKDPKAWNEEVQRVYDDLPPDTELTLIDCHQ